MIWMCKTCLLPLPAIRWRGTSFPELVVRGKLRHALRGKGKSGGLRTIHYFGGTDVPVFLLAIYGKNQRANITSAEKNELAKLLPQIVDNYRKKSVR